MTRQAVKKKPGQSMIETLIALGIGVLIIVALVQSIVTSIKNSQFAKNQTLATRFSQEGIEIIRSVRDRLGWPSFYNSYNTKTKCLGSNDYTTWGDTLPCTINTGDIFSRQASFSDPSGSGNQILVNVTTAWTDTTGSHKSEQQTYLTKWQQ
ncbi:hypothetical protein HY030_01015 [Candidatus Gottesmanbacteria bacterium]|nr:hypothetical protein [Candidatus Gottesmanbacteria bacterium]